MVEFILAKMGRVLIKLSFTLKLTKYTHKSCNKLKQNCSLCLSTDISTELVHPSVPTEVMNKKLNINNLQKGDQKTQHA